MAGLECPARTEQPLRQLTTFEHQFFQGLFDMAVLDDKFYAIMALICCEEGRFAHQFADKGRAHSLRLVNELRQALSFSCVCIRTCYNPSYFES